MLIAILLFSNTTHVILVILVILEGDHNLAFQLFLCLLVVILVILVIIVVILLSMIIILVTINLESNEN